VTERLLTPTDTVANEQLAGRRADPRYQRLMDATRAAAREGYDAVSMRELAETCRMSMTTIYQFCRSKDQLIAEAHLSTMEGFRDRVLARPPRGASAADRVAKVMRSYAKALEVDETLSRTMMRAMYSLDPAAAESRGSIRGTYKALIDAAIGDEPVTERDAVISTLGHVVDSVILGWVTSRHDVAWVRRELDTAVVALFARPTGPPRKAARRAAT
jgi:TetR/AcrR family transcriptional regulator, cholesterol catabolism regulator